MNVPTIRKHRNLRLLNLHLKVPVFLPMSKSGVTTERLVLMCPNHCNAKIAQVLAILPKYAGLRVSVPFVAPPGVVVFPTACIVEKHIMQDPLLVFYKYNKLLTTRSALTIPQAKHELAARGFRDPAKTNTYRRRLASPQNAQPPPTPVI